MKLSLQLYTLTPTLHTSHMSTLHMISLLTDQQVQTATAENWGVLYETLHILSYSPYTSHMSAYCTDFVVYGQTGSNFNCMRRPKLYIYLHSYSPYITYVYILHWFRCLLQAGSNFNCMRRPKLYIYLHSELTLLHSYSPYITYVCVLYDAAAVTQSIKPVTSIAYILTYLACVHSECELLVVYSIEYGWLWNHSRPPEMSVSWVF
jgi:hypothetical protein